MQVSHSLDFITLEHTATNCNTLQHHHPGYYHLEDPSAQAPHSLYCNTLQQTATHCNTLQHTEFRKAAALRRVQGKFVLYLARSCSLSLALVLSLARAFSLSLSLTHTHTTSLSHTRAHTHNTICVVSVNVFCFHACHTDSKAGADSTNPPLYYSAGI